MINLYEILEYLYLRTNNLKYINLKYSILLINLYVRTNKVPVKKFKYVEKGI